MFALLFSWIIWSRKASNSLSPVIFVLSIKKFIIPDPVFGGIINAIFGFLKVELVLVKKKLKAIIKKTILLGKFSTL
jgi:Na+/glutamate symporter